jgi:hypothetical protein
LAHTYDWTGFLSETTACEMAVLPDCGFLFRFLQPALGGDGIEPVVSGDP